MKTQAEEWKEKLLGCKIVDVDIDETHIKSIILENGKMHIELFPDREAGINAIHIRYEKQRRNKIYVQKC